MIKRTEPSKFSEVFDEPIFSDEDDITSEAYMRFGKWIAVPLILVAFLLLAAVSLGWNSDSNQRHSILLHGADVGKLVPDTAVVLDDGGEFTVAVLAPPGQRGLEGGDALLSSRVEQCRLVADRVVEAPIAHHPSHGIEVSGGDLTSRERRAEPGQLPTPPSPSHQRTSITRTETTEQPQPLLRRPGPVEAPPARVAPRTQARRQLHLQGLELIAQADDLGGLLPHRHHVGDLIDLWLRTHVRSVKNFLPLDNPDR